MAGNFVEGEGNVFEEIEVDEGEEILVENEKSIYEENEVVVLEDSEGENEHEIIHHKQKKRPFPDLRCKKLSSFCQNSEPVNGPLSHSDKKNLTILVFAQVQILDLRRK
ncbi:13911_t:CDS:2, partial [Gigaspora rosea]